MNDLLEQLGIDWKLFLSQAMNFFILLFALRVFVYKPVLGMIKKRQEKIEEGLVKAEEANVRLKEVDNIAKNKLKETEAQSIEMIKNTEQKAKKLEQELVKEAHDLQKELLLKAKAIAASRQAESQKMIQKEAVDLVKKAIAKTVELDPDKIDDSLIKKALTELK